MFASTAIANGKYLFILEHQKRIFILKNKTNWGKFKHAYDSFINIFMPFKENINMINIKYDRDVQIFFEIARYIYIISVFTVFIFFYFLISHGLNSKFTPASETFCKYSIPCFLFYSSIQQSEISAFSITYAISAIFLIFMTSTKWLSYKKLTVNSQLYFKEESTYAQFIFNSWDWGVQTKPTYLEKKRRMRQLFTIGMKEVEFK